MRKIIDWFRISTSEFCKKYGHKKSTFTYKAYVECDIAAAQRAEITITECSRCGKQFKKDIKKGAYIDSLTMPSEMWDELRRCGDVMIKG